YGGRWDILQAMRSMLASKPQLAQQPALIGEADFSAFLTMADAPEPDLFIRTGGEQRVSNFLLWHLAYTELYFTETLWPDFDEEAFDQALESYRRRERRFGRTSEQIRVES
ncbi:MAG: di-trans,poly-cis-decaprenylcistransferase, partial [Betaproteobacteria bacterium]|nr:di-trans,poly-cis-decaprenylcistransferase [Betaproteobacteria bacterium]